MDKVLIVIAFYVVMEFVAWIAHRYLMHGLLWTLHRDHHQKDPESKLERNDWFFVLFALPGILLFVIGAQNPASWMLWAGIGITLYGFTYFSIHEVLVHRRLSWFKKPKGRYLRGLMKAHANHHKHLGKNPGENYGLLLVPFKYFKS